MKPPATTHAAIVGGAQASASFDISTKDAAHIMGILRDTLYSDKILAVLREYASNAWDAHRSVGKHELPIQITLPTDDDPTLRIRDFGPGLSHEDVFTVYTQYGASTKRDSNDAVGMLGIGSKSGFAYSDSFTITSWHNEVKRTYVAALDESDKGVISLLAETSCALSETGVEIQIAVRPGDIQDFERTARRLFQHFAPRPEINIELPASPEERTVLTNGIITPGTDGGWVAVMGCVPYRVNVATLDEREISKCLQHLSGTLTFGIGEVHVNASREELKYSAHTKAVLVTKFNALVDEYVTAALQELDAGTLSGWQTRLRVQVLSQLELPLPQKYKGLAEGFAQVTYKPGDFTLLSNKAACTRISVTNETTLLVDDTGLALDGYMLGYNDYIVRSKTKTVDELRATLDKVLVASGLTGVSIELLSSRHWTAPVVPVKRVASPKHRARMFVLEPKSANKFKAPWSQHWTVEVERIPEPTDIYVVIEGFKARDNEDFFVEYSADRDLAKAFGVELPKVYGYKHTEKRPVDPVLLVGIEYSTWRKQFVKELLTPERTLLIDELRWSTCIDRHGSRNFPSVADRKRLNKALGKDHPILVLCDRCEAAHEEVLKHDRDALRMLASRTGYESDEAAKRAVETIFERYPLFRSRGLRELWPYVYDNADASERDAWAHYVQMVDQALTPVTNNVVHLKSVP